MGLDLVKHVIHDHLAGECLAVAPEGFKHLLMDTPQHHFGVGIYICTIRLHAHNCRRCVSTGLLKYTEGCDAERPLRVCGFDPTRGVSITVNIGTAAVLYTLHDTFDPLSLEGQKCHEAVGQI